MNCLERIRYNTLHIIHVIEIGLSLFEFDGSPFLKIGVIIDFFQIFGILPDN